jgi:chromosome segregation ATPase
LDVNVDNDNDDGEESVRLRDELNVALQSVQDITTEKDALSNDKAANERLLQERQLSLQTVTQQNANLIQQQEELNQSLQALAAERDTAMDQKDDALREMELASSREREVTVEKESAVARGLDLQAQFGPLQQRVKELQRLSDDIPNLQQSLECARSEAKQLPVLQEQVMQSTNRIKSLEQELSTQEQKVVQMKTMEDSLQRLQLLADSIPSLKESRQKYFTAFKQSQETSMIYNLN